MGRNHDPCNDLCGRKQKIHQDSHHVVSDKFCFYPMNILIRAGDFMGYISEFFHQEIPKTGTAMPAYYR